ncbi:helix-turn-helix transcriptional regulator [Priestia flexa]|uniref:helix-turn-helix transcriptional regulator n=1 Tax=Priestia flexa TaxID=86664 RepID=UPI00240D0525|nr:helix-turn-helix transcriptional regulator [Priestia flexa]WEZ09978.1 helix-turn-helix transcriptional regulator [Priestia flexa]
MVYEVKRRHLPYTKLKAFLSEIDVKQKDLAQTLGISNVALNQKINGTGGDFSLEEVRKICRHLNISSDAFFIEPQVSKMITKQV